MPNICNNTCLVKSTNYILHINVGKLFHTHIYNKNKKIKKNAWYT